MSQWDAPVHIWSGLFSKKNARYQDGLRHVADQIDDCQFHPTLSGYDGWEEVRDSAIRRKVKSIVLGGHSNGNKATTFIARDLKEHGIKCYLFCFDRTMGRCAKLGANVPEAIDMWAGPPMKKLVKGPDFNGNLRLYPFREESHISIITNERAQQLAIEFGKKWKRL